MIGKGGTQHSLSEADVRRLVQAYFAAGDAPGRIQQADNRGTGHGFAGAGLSHHSQNFTGFDMKRHIVHRHQSAVASRELDPQVPHFEQGMVGHGGRFSATSG